jgi:hypothetical protein
MGVNCRVYANDEANMWKCGGTPQNSLNEIFRAFSTYLSTPNRLITI